MNAIRHGLTGHVVVMTSEDQEAHDRHCQGFAEHFQPQGLLGNADPTAPALSDEVQANLPLWSAATVRDHHYVFATLSLYEQRLIRTYEKTLNQLKQFQDVSYWREFRERQAQEDLGEEIE
jgi:hypothetical protein